MNTNNTDTKMNNETVIIAGIEIDKDVAYRCMKTVEPAILDVVTSLIKSGAPKEAVIEAAKTTAEAVVTGMVFMTGGLKSPTHLESSAYQTPPCKSCKPTQAEEPQ